MSGYKGTANTILNELGMYPNGNPHTPTIQPHSTTKYEFDDIGGGEQMLNIANPAGCVKCLFKFSP